MTESPESERPLLERVSAYLARCSGKFDAEDEATFQPKSAAALREFVGHLPVPIEPVKPLSAVDKAIIAGIAAGATSTEIGAEFGISRLNMNLRISRLRRRLGIPLQRPPKPKEQP